MTKTQQRQMARGNAFNKILKIYHPKSDFKVSEFPRDESYGEKRDSIVREIVENYLKKLQSISHTN